MAQHNVLMTSPNPDVANSRPHRLIRHSQFWVGLLVFCGLVAFCFVGPFIYTKSPYTIHYTMIGHPPSRALPLGGDELGRNELSRLMLGGRLLIIVALAAAMGASLGGVALGLLAGFRGGFMDRLITWVSDVVLGIPQLIPLLLVDAMLRPSAISMMIIVTATSWPMIAKLVRADILSLRERDYVLAAESMGARGSRIMWRHLLPNLWSTIIVAASSQVSQAVLVVATASFLGFGLPPPDPNWAGMIASSTQAIWNGYWWIMVFPGAALVILQLSINSTTEALREMFVAGGGH